jgi:type II secretory pathway component GspD/PulD (secretin)
MLTERGKLTFDSRINALIVTDLATNIYKVKQIVQDIDKRTPQIMIEAKIIETTLGKDERLGINWNLVAGASGARRPITAPFQVFGAWQTATHHVFEYLPRAQPATSTSTTPAGGGVAVQTTTAQDFPTDWTAPFPFASKDEFTFGTLDFTQFSMVMEYLKSRSDTDIISSPRITTLNNKEAKMFVGKVYNYISEIEEKESESGSERWTYKIEKEEIGIRLLVTPQVSDIGDIRVKLKPEIKDVIGFQQVTQFFSLPIFTTREAETQVLMRNGDTIFIGGLIKENINEYEKKFPLLGDILGGIPYLGNLFKYETETKSKTELVIFLTVHLVTSSEMTKGFAMQGMSEIKVPMGGDEDFAKNQIKDIEKETVRSRKKRHEPLFDFRKKK